MGETTVLGHRAVNRATLDRQLLLRRSEASVPEALERLVGLQAQTPHTWYLGLWSRLEGFTPEPTGRLLADRGIVRMALMRSTIHLVTPADCLWLRPLVQPVIERMTVSNFGRHLTGLERSDLVAAAREMLTDEPLTFAELGRRLAGRWPRHDPTAMAQMVRAWVPLVQVPPRGVWGSSGQPAHSTVEAWLGRPVDQDPAPETLVLRYLAGFGPATIRDIQHWSGLTRLREVVEALRPRLAVFNDEEGRELFDLLDAPRPDPETPAPVRFLYDYDNLLRSYADISRVMTVDFADHGFTKRTARTPCAVLVDGFVAATWHLQVNRSMATLAIRPFRKLTAAEEEDLHREAAGVISFCAPRASVHEIVLERPHPG